MDVLVTYDIANTETSGARRLRRIADVCSSYGQRVQFSVFECRVGAERFERFMGEIEDVIDPKQDSVVIYRFPGVLRESRVDLGRPANRELGEPWML